MDKVKLANLISKIHPCFEATKYDMFWALNFDNWYDIHNMANNFKTNIEALADDGSWNIKRRINDLVGHVWP